MGGDHLDAAIGADGPTRFGFEFAVDRLFPKDHAPLGREPAHQVLRPLEHEVPPQMRKADEGMVRRRRRSGTPLRSGAVDFDQF
jgi:hypothetical protein